MAQRIFKTTEPVKLDGYQAIFQPSKKHNNYCLMALIDQDLVDELEDDRIECLKWAESRLKNPRRATLKHAPWEQVEGTDYYKATFNWKEHERPPIVDSEGTPITDSGIKLYNGTVKIGFRQKPYVQSGDIYGTRLVMLGIQVISIESGVGVDRGDLDDAAVAELFGKTAGYKANDPNVAVAAPEVDLDDDF